MSLEVHNGAVKGLEAEVGVICPLKTLKNRKRVRGVYEAPFET